MTVPGWYALLLLGLAAFRTWKLVGEDTILDRPRALVIRHTGENVETLLECPWCAGFWIALAWWGAYELWPHGTLIAAVPLAVSALVGAFAHVTSDD